MHPTSLFGMYAGVQVAFKVCVDLLLLCMEFSDNLSVNFMEVIHEPVSFNIIFVVDDADAIPHRALDNRPILHSVLQECPLGFVYESDVVW